MRWVFQDLLDIILPWSCPLCGSPGSGPHGACRQCAGLLLRDPGWRCPECGSALTVPACCRPRSGGALDGLLAATGYGEAARRSVHLFKYSRRAPAGRMMGEFLALAVDRLLDVACDGVVPVPLGRRRQRERGFNQAAQLARRVGGRLGRRVLYGTLVRVRETSSQADLGIGARRENVSEAFRVRVPEMVKGRSLLLVDDVYTTGSTMGECARVLKGAGAALVVGAVFACAPRDLTAGV